MGRFLVPFLKSCHFFVFVLGGSLQHHVKSIYLYSSNSEHLQKILYGFKFRRHQLYDSTFESLVSTQICLQGAGSRCPTEPEKAANCQTAKPRGPRKPPTAVVQRCDVIVVDLSCNHESGRGIRHLCRCVMLADFLKDCHWITLWLLWGGVMWEVTMNRWNGSRQANDSRSLLHARACFPKLLGCETDTIRIAHNFWRILAKDLLDAQLSLRNSCFEGF